MSYKNHTNYNLLLQLLLVGFESRDKALFHAVGSVGGTADGVHILAQGFVDGEAVPRFIKTAFHYAFCKVRRLLVLQ